MKKQLLSIFAALTVSSVVAQTPSPSWTIAQNANFTLTTAGHRFLDAVDQNVVWLSGYDGVNAAANYNWWSKTTNGGASYTSGNIFPDTTHYSLSNMEGVDASTAWVCAFQRSAPYSNADPGGGVVYKTTNGGTTWTNMTAAGMFTNTTSSFANWVSFLTPQVGIVNGDPVNGAFELWKTTNGGTSWAQIPSASIPAPLAQEFCITDLYCKQGTTNLWFGTNKGRIYRTNDAGATWNVSAIAASPNATITEVAFVDANNGLMYASTGTSAAPVLSMYNSTDGGVTWNLIHNNVDATASANLFIGRNDLCPIPGTGYFASVDNANQLLSYSMDNGMTWTDWGSVGIPYVCIDMVDGHTGWVAGFSDDTNPALDGIFKYNGITFNSAFTVPQYVCKGVTDATITPVNGSSASTALTFSWTGSAGVQFSSTTASVPVITFTANGTYTISLAATNVDGTNVSSHVVTVLTCAVPTTTFNMATTGCNNVSIALTSTTTGAPVPLRTVSTNPSTSVTVTQSNSNGNNYTIKFNDAGTYTVTLNASSTAGSATYSQVIVISDCTPVADFELPTFVCKLDTAIAVNTTSANALGGTLSYTWSILPNQPNFATPTGTANRGFGFTNTTITYPRTFTVTLKARNTTTTTVVTHTIVADNCYAGIATNGALSALNVYPNPAHDVLNVVLPASTDATVRLLNVLGAVVYEEKTKIKETISINLANRAKGVYFLNVEANGEKVTKKIIVE